MIAKADFTDRSPMPGVRVRERVTGRIGSIANYLGPWNEMCPVVFDDQKEGEAPTILQRSALDVLTGESARTCIDVDDWMAYRNTKLAERKDIEKIYFSSNLRANTAEKRIWRWQIAKFEADGWFVKADGLLTARVWRLKKSHEELRNEARQFARRMVPDADPEEYFAARGSET